MKAHRILRELAVLLDFCFADWLDLVRSFFEAVNALFPFDVKSGSGRYLLFTLGEFKQLFIVVHQVPVRPIEFLCHAERLDGTFAAQAILGHRRRLPWFYFSTAQGFGLALKF